MKGCDVCCIALNENTIPITQGTSFNICEHVWVSLKVGEPGAVLINTALNWPFWMHFKWTDVSLPVPKLWEVWLFGQGINLEEAVYHKSCKLCYYCSWMHPTHQSTSWGHFSFYYFQLFVCSDEDFHVLSRQLCCWWFLIQVQCISNGFLKNSFKLRV